MVKNKKIIAIIPARGGNKGVPRKNIKLLDGKPLISYAIRASLKSKFIDRVIVSTDDAEIAEVAKKYKAEVPFMRPAELAQDNSPTLPVLQHAVNYLEEKENYQIDLVVLLQSTTPLILASDIDNAIKKLMQTKTNSCVSVYEINERPEGMYVIKNGRIKLFLGGLKDGRRQDLPKIFRVNGGVYVMTRNSLMENNKIIDGDSASAVIMPKERSVDVDEPIDFYIIETIIKQIKFNSLRYA